MTIGAGFWKLERRAGLILFACTGWGPNDGGGDKCSIPKSMLLASSIPESSKIEVSSMIETDPSRSLAGVALGEVDPEVDDVG